MSDVTLQFADGSKETIEDPTFVDTLCNVNEVAVDGDVYGDVTQVTYDKLNDL